MDFKERTLFLMEVKMQIYAAIGFLIHPRNLTWPRKNCGWETTFLLERVILYFRGVFFDDPKLPAAHSLKMPMAKDAEIV